MINYQQFKTVYRNVYVEIDGTIHPLPFHTQMPGLWYFDGQVFYLKESR